MLKSLIGMIILIIVAAETCRANEIIMTLTHDKKLECFDHQGQKQASIRLVGSNKTYISMTAGNFIKIASKEKQLVFLRNDGYLDIYPFPSGTEQSLKRIAYKKLLPVAGRKSLFLTAHDIDADSPGDELIALQSRTAKDKTTDYAYIYSMADNKAAVSRKTYFGISNVPTPFVALDVAADKALTCTENGFIEEFIQQNGNWKRIKQFKPDIADRIVAVRYFNGFPSALLADNSIIIFVQDGSFNAIRPDSPATFIDYIVSNRKEKSHPPAKNVSWNNGSKQGTLNWSWQGVDIPSGSIVTINTPDGNGTALQYSSRNKISLIPLNIKLPANTNSIGVWLDTMEKQGQHYSNKINTQIRFNLRSCGNTRNIAAEMLDAPGTTPLSTRFHPHARFGDWVLWKTFINTNDPKELILESIEIHKKSIGDFVLGPVMTGIKETRPHNAENVWKIKNFSEEKPWSTYWTANEWHEYFYDGKAFLRPLIWQKNKPEKIIAQIKTSSGKLVTALEIKGEKLQQNLSLPDLDEGTYFCYLELFGRDHRFITELRMVVQKLKGGVATAVLNKNDSIIPCVISRPELDVAVGKPGDIIEFQLQPNHGLEKIATKWSWIIDDTEGMNISSGYNNAFDKEHMNIRFNSPRAGGYCLKVNFYNNKGTRVYSMNNTFGVADLCNSSVSKPVKQGDSGIRSRPLMLSTAQVLFDPGQVHRLPQYTLPALISASVNGQNTPVINLRWAEIEPVKGVYNFYLIDRMLDLGSYRDAKPWIGIAFSGDNIPEWLWFEELTSQDNRTIHLGYHYVNPMGKRFTQAHRNLYRTLFERYKNDPRLGGWFYYAGPSEGFLTDTYPMICGYSTDAIERFRQWLNKTYKADINKLNSSWRTSYRNLDSVSPPYPEFGKQWEESPQWRDFTRFKQDFVIERLTELHKMLREIDPERPALMYAKEGFGATGAIAPVFKKYNIHYSNGGGEGFMSYVQASIMNNFGVPVTCEGHYVMPQPGSVFCVLANSILAGNFGGNNVQWGLVWAKRAHDDMPATKLIMYTTRIVNQLAPELARSAQASPRWACYFSAINALHTKRQFRLTQNNTMNQLRHAAQYILHQQESWVDEYCGVDILKRYPVIVDGDSKIMTPEAVDHILEYVRNGGTLVTSLTMGQFMPGKSASQYQLASRFGIEKLKINRMADEKAIHENHELFMTDVQIPIGDFKDKLKPLAYDNTGQTMLWLAALGKGRVIFSAGDVNYEKSAAWLEHILHKYSGANTFAISSDGVIQAGVLENNDSYFIIIRPQGVGRSMNSTIEQMNSSPMLNVKISSPGISGRQIKEYISNTVLQVSDDAVQLKAKPGMLYLIKISK
jgi:hypothetical protein